MKRAVPTPLPLEQIQDHIADRIAEAIAIASGQRKLDEFPKWTQHVMRILRKQLLPDELVGIFAGDMTIFNEGIVAGLFGQIGELSKEKPSRRLIRKLSERVIGKAGYARAAQQISTGAVVKQRAFQRHVLRRIFKGKSNERRAFAEGLALGCRVFDLCSEHAARSQTDATPVYMMLWLFWPEIDRMKSVGEVGRALGLVFSTNPNQAGNWNERFRKIANRIHMSFRERQDRCKMHPSPTDKLAPRLSGGGG